MQLTIFMMLSRMRQDKGIDHVNQKLDEFINNTVDGLSQTVSGEIITPVQNLLVNNYRPVRRYS